MKSEEQQRRRHQHPAEGGLAPPYQHQPGERRQRRRPAEAPGERPQVVEDAPLVGRPQLALRFGGLARLAHQFGVEGVRVEHRVGVGDHEQRHRRQRGGEEAHEHPLPGVRPGPPQTQDGGRQQRHEHDSGRVLGGARQTEGGPGEQVVADPPFPEHPRGPEQRGRQRRQRGHVVQRQVGVEGRQERHRLDRRRQQPGRPPDQAGPDEVQQPQGRACRGPPRRCGPVRRPPPGRAGSG